jgi:DNA (cytosine-5)-methyltransferase 1
MTTTLKYGSLFSGVGGFDMGFDLENYECVFQVEWDKHCQKILAKHWPEVPKWSDVQDVNGAEIPPCDVLTFGSPCQDLSVAGKRAGLEGTKSSMFYEATRIIKEMRNATESVYPRIVVWENVPGALSSNNGADFGAVLDTLAECGAVDIQWSVLDAQYFGVPQRRRRIFVVAIFDTATSERCPDPLLPVIKGSRGDFAKGRKAQQDAARSATSGIETGGQWWDGETTADCLTTTSNEQRMPDKNRLQAVLVPTFVFDGTRHDDFRMDTDTVPTLKSRMGTGGGQVPMLAEPIMYDALNDVINTIPGTLRTNHASSGDFIAQPIFSFDTQFGSNAAVFENQSPTLKATQQSPSVTMPGLAVRRLTPLECERLMGWPDDHTRWKSDGTEQADTHRYKQCGNGVATPVARFIAKHLKKILITDDEGDQ